MRIVLFSPRSCGALLRVRGKPYVRTAESNVAGVLRARLAWRRRESVVNWPSHKRFNVNAVLILMLLMSTARKKNKSASYVSATGQSLVPKSAHEMEADERSTRGT